MNIILTGMRGAGKSTVGKILSQELDKEFLDLDEMLEKKLDMKISEVVKKHGWNYFREQEAIIVQNLNVNNAIIATGGGVILNIENIKALKRDGIFIYLSADIATLLSRIEDSENRPSLTDEKTAKEELKEVLKQRKKLYEETADVAIDTDNLNASETVSEIFKKFKTLCMVIGDPVEHSLSPKMHNAAYEVLGINDKYHYIKCNITSSRLEGFVKDVKKLGICGVSCTIPHKIEVMKYLDKIDSIAEKIGAVNTVVNKNGILTGYNTDYLGIIIPLEKLTKLENKKIVILGAGGAARAVLFALSGKGANVCIHNRTAEKSKILAKEFGAKVILVKNLNLISNFDIIINATSVGLHGDESALEKKYMLKGQIVFDLVYLQSGDTKLIKDAKEQGAKTISGVEMLLHQGYEQFKLFTGINAPIDTMRKALL